MCENDSIPAKAEYDLCSFWSGVSSLNVRVVVLMPVE